MQYDIMLIAKYWNKLLKFHSLCCFGEYGGILISSFLRHTVAHAAFHDAGLFYQVYKYSIRKGGGHAVDLCWICFPPLPKFYHWEGWNDWLKYFFLWEEKKVDLQRSNFFYNKKIHA